MSYIGKAPGVGVRNRYYFTATGGETSLSGTDDASNTLAFSDGKYVDVALNGVTLVAGTDYDTATANTIDNLTALTAGDVVEVVVYDVFSIASAVPVTGGTFAGPVIFNGELIVPRGTTAQRPASPSTGSLRFNTSASAYEGYDGTGWVFLSDPTIEVEYLVIAGGGGGGGINPFNGSGGGGGAGGYLEGSDVLLISTAYTVTVGSGGAGGASGANPGVDGGASVFNTMSAIGGGGGGTGQVAGNDGRIGGSGGGGGYLGAAGTGTGGQGNNGGSGGASATTPYGGGGGGGAGAVGGSGHGGSGGAGTASSITGVSVTRAGGGGGGVETGSAGAGGAGGGGDGGSNAAGVAATVNTGGGGGGGGGPSAQAGGAGGSGVVILKIPSSKTATFSAGVTQSSATVGAYTVYTITAAGASDTVTFS